MFVSVKSVIKSGLYTLHGVVMKTYYCVRDYDQAFNNRFCGAALFDCWGTRGRALKIGKATARASLGV